MVLLNSGESFDMSAGTTSAPFTPPDPLERARYVREVLSAKSYTYENGACAEGARTGDLTAQLRAAHGRMLRHMARINYRSPWRLYLDTGGEDLHSIPFADGSVERVRLGEERAPFLRIGVDPALLLMILDRRAHWNNAEIGSHLRFFRSPDEDHRELRYFLYHFHN